MAVSRNKITKIALIFVGIGIAVGLAMALLVMQLEPTEEGDPYDRLSLSERTALVSSFVSASAKYKSKIVVNEDSSFTSAGQGGKPPYQYEWKFSDGITSSLQNMTRSFPSIGSYSGQITVKDSAGKTGQSSFTVEVVPEVTTS